MRKLLGDAAAPGNACDIDLAIPETLDQEGGETSEAGRTIGQLGRRRTADSRHIENDRGGFGQRFKEWLGELPVCADAVEEKQRRTRSGDALHRDHQLL